jgi:sugar/nucleoside kinase (ribokinase family)
VYPNSAANILVAGHVVVDEIIDFEGQKVPRRALGGPISYCSLALKSLGYTPAVVTHVGEDFPSEYLEFLKKNAGIDLSSYVSPGFRTTSYRIDRSGEHRKLWLASRCKELSLEDFSPFLSRKLPVPEALVVNPVANEVSLSLLQRISKEFDSVFVDSQGFVRRFSRRDHEVAMRNGLDISSLAGVEFLKCDLQELSAWVGTRSKDSALRQLGKFVETILLTSGPGVIEIFQNGSRIFSAKPFKVEASDTTGAGDIMLSSFAGRFSETEHLKESLRFAVAASTLAVRKMGKEKSLLGRDEVLRYSQKVELE